MSKKKTLAKTAKTTKTAKRSGPSTRARRSRAAERAQSDELAQASAGTADNELAAGHDAGDPVSANASDDTGGTGDIGADGAVARTRPPIPPVGTVIRKLDRYGKLRCKCSVVEGGIRYNGKVYRSLSGAAMAAAGDLGLKNKTQNGYVFWKLTKIARKITDPVGAIQASWRRYHNVVTAALKVATDKNRAEVRAALREQGQTIGTLAADVTT